MKDDIYLKYVSHTHWPLSLLTTSITILIYIMLFNAQRVFNREPNEKFISTEYIDVYDTTYFLELLK